MERLNTYVVSASIENASIQNLNEPVTVSLHHIVQNRVGCVHFIRDRGNAAVHCIFWDFVKNSKCYLPSWLCPQHQTMALVS
ncbi:hypothetical protein DV515_00007274 [Chloebia gouldiae]|uniref:GAIN-B domain-containing protein n=1 Tax=Chloebia gouldiae TaxID=44316 RepID=A0A3L8SJ63_CHLGU|nr:hypothetical protein DV515_00007274 [Chloebia gouldiae]